MRKLPLLLIVLLLSLLAAAPSAQALSAPALLAAPADTPGEEADETDGVDGEDENEAEEDEGSGECTIEDEEDVQLCAEIAQEEREEARAERCVVEDATARVTPHPGNDTVQLTIRYKATAPTAVAVDVALRGSQGRLHLGAKHTRFRRAGIFRNTFALSEGQMERALAARKFTVELQAVNAPRYCRLSLNGAPRRARR